MSAISDRELLAVWEAAQAVPSVLRPAALLRAAGEEAEPETLPVSVRDRRLLALRRAWFGEAFEALVDCPRCTSPVELTFDGAAFDAAVEDRHSCLSIDGITYRPPDTTDLAAIRHAIDVDDARAQLAARCIIDAAPAEILDAAPDFTVDLTCPDCGASWEAAFDPAAYLLRELDGAAVRIFQEIDALAVAYGWSEGEILALSRARRRTYLRMVTA